LLQRFLHIISRYPDYHKKKYLVAVSGGIDSMVLLDLMLKSGLDIAVAHCNFKLRGKNSDADMEWVKEICKKNNIPFYGKICPVNKTENIQLAARRLRYEWFDELRKKHAFDYLLTAHHADDNLETFFINLFRGSGLKGLTGIHETESIKRPLLNFTREEIEKYAVAQQIKWREDASNRTDAYLRNAIRLKLLPLIEEIRPGSSHAILNSMDLLKASREVEEEWFDQLKNKIIRQDNHGQFVFLKQLPGGKKRNLFLFKWLSPYGFSDFKAINKLLNAQGGKYVESPAWRLIKHEEKLILVPQKNNSSNKISFNKIPDEIKQPVHLKFDRINPTEISPDRIKKSSPKIAYVDADLLSPPYEIRLWKPGERMQPFGMKGSKKISDILTDLKVPLHLKEKTYVLTSAGKPVWLIGYKTDDKYKIHDKTRRILKISLIESD